MLPVDLPIGNHLITVSVSATGRYAPVIISAQLNVVKSIPVSLTTDLPSVVFIPGSFSLRGKLNSGIGPVAQAGITMTFGGKTADAVSGADGTFNASFRNNMGFGLFGSQTLEFKVMPVEPWQTALTVSRKVMTVYVVNCGVFFLILVLLGIILPHRLKFRVGISQKRKLPQAVSVGSPKSASLAIASVTNNIPANNDDRDKSASPGRLFYWYRMVIQLVQRVSGVLMKPNQTLREYVRDTSNVDISVFESHQYGIC